MEPAPAEASHDGAHYIATVIALSIRVAYLGGLFKSPQFDSHSRVILIRHQIDALCFGVPSNGFSIR